jgi:hypothetical protein
MLVGENRRRQAPAPARSRTQLARSTGTLDPVSNRNLKGKTLQHVDLAGAGSPLSFRDDPRVHAHRYRRTDDCCTWLLDTRAAG